MDQEKIKDNSDVSCEEESDLTEALGCESKKDTDIIRSLRDGANIRNSQTLTLECSRNNSYSADLLREDEVEITTDKSVTLSREENLSSIDSKALEPFENDILFMSSSEKHSGSAGSSFDERLSISSNCSNDRGDIVYTGSEFAVKERILCENSLVSTGKYVSSQDQEARKDSHENLLEGEEPGNDLDNSREESDQEEEMEWPSKDFHTYILGKICRICAEMTVVFDGPKKGVPKIEMIRYVKKIWKVDMSDEDPNQYPVNICLNCERKIKRLYAKVSKKKKCEIFRSQPAEFEPHKDKDCSICLLKDADIEAQTQQEIQKEEKMHEENDSKVELISEPRRNPARKRGWPDHEAPYKSVGCQADTESVQDATTGLEEHDYIQQESGILDQCLAMPKKVTNRAPYQKQPLSSVNAKYIRQDRLKPLISHIDKFCQSQKESKVEVLFFLLMQALRDAGDRSRETAVIDIWTKKGTEGTSLTEEECLAKRILLKQTKEQYRKEYRYYKEKLEKPVLKPPFIINKLERTYFPEYLDYYVTERDSGPIVYKHEKVNNHAYFALQESVDNGTKSDGVMGIRWRYFDAVAKTLEEFTYTLENDMLELTENSCIHVDLSDYCEEKKDMTNLTDKNEAVNSKRYQSKMITYLFCVQSLQAVTGDVINWTYNKDISVCRPLMKALVSDASALQSSMLMIEKERNRMAGNYFHIRAPNGTLVRFMVFFSNEAPEVRRDYRNIAGLSLSSFKKAPCVINRYGNLCLELKRSWLASSPRLSHVGRLRNLRSKCSRCGEHGHNIRKCSKPSPENLDGTNVIQHKKQKKHRSIPSDAYPSSTSEMSQVNAELQQHSIQQQSLEQLKRERDLTLMPSAPPDVSHSSAVMANEEQQLLWTCPNIDYSSRIDSHHSQNTQVLIPASNSEYQIVPQRTLVQGSHGSSSPVCVWAYTIVQPPSESNVQQQSSTHQLTELPVHQQTNQQQQMTVHHLQQQQQQQQPGQHLTSHQLQQLPVIHQQPSSEVTLSVSHQHESRASGQNVQQLNIIHQPRNSLQPVETSEHLTLAHQDPNVQSQSHQQISVVHQQQVSQTVNIVQHLSQPQLQHNPETSSSHEQLSHSQNSTLQPVIGQW